MNLYFTICTLVFAVLLNVVFRVKRRAETNETDILSSLLSINLVGLVLQMVISLLVGKSEISPMISILLARFYFLYLELFLLMFTIYIITVLYKENRKDKYYKILKNTSMLVFYLCAVATIFMPVALDNGCLSGVALSFVHLLTSVSLFLWFISLVKNIKKVASRKIVSIGLFILVMAVTIWLEISNANLVIMACVHFLGLNMLYYTWDGDSDDSLDRKLFGRVIFNIESFLKNVHALMEEKTDLEVVERSLKQVSEYADNVRDVILDEDAKLQFITKDYDFASLLKSIIKKGLVADKAIQIECTYEEGAITRLKGDVFRVEKLLTNLLSFIALHTESGTINLKIDTIGKVSIARQIISITADGCKIVSKEINNLPVNYGLEDIATSRISDERIRLAAILKNVTLLNGKLAISHNHENEYKVVVAIEQEVSKVQGNREDSDDIGIKLNEENIYRGKKILLVDDDELHIKVAQNAFRGYNVDVTFQSTYEEFEMSGYDLVFCDEKIAEKVSMQNRVDDKVIVIMSDDDCRTVRDNVPILSEYSLKPLNKAKLDELLKKYLK